LGAKQAIREGRDRQLLLTSGRSQNPVENERQRRTSQLFVKTPNSTEEKAILKGTTGKARLRGSDR
jgi:hypothetical protein